MSSLEVTYPENNTLSWSDSLTLTVSGYAEDNSEYVVINGSSVDVTLNSDKTWSYTITASSYQQNDLHIESRDSLDEIISELDYSIKVSPPVLYTDTYNTKSVTIFGKTSEISKGVEYSFDNNSYFNVDVLSGNDFSFNIDFSESSQEVYLKGIDQYGVLSDVTQHTVYYKLNAPEILEIPSITSTTNVTVSGRSDLETSGFIYYPDEISSSGVFASGSVSGDMLWSYTFNILSPEQNFSIKSFDCFGSESEEVTGKISYLMAPPEITYPVEEYTSNFDETVKGNCQANCLSVLYSSNSSWIKPRVSSEIGPFQIDPQNNSLILDIDGEKRVIIFTLGNLTSESIAEQINSLFSKSVARDENSRVVLEGNLISIVGGTVISLLGFNQGSYGVSCEIAIPETTSFSGRDILEINVDGNDYKVIFSKEISYSEDEVIKAINNCVGKKIAYSGFLTAEKNIYIKKKFSDLGIEDPLYVGKVQNNLGSWSLSFRFFKPSLIWNFWSLDEFYNLTETSSKSVEYILHAPFILSPGKQKSITDNSYLSVSGSTSFFETSSGSFSSDGVIESDSIVVLSGKNIGKSCDILSVSEKFLEISGIDADFRNGDTIAIYSEEDRPEITSNTLTIKYSGKCDPGSKAVIYSDSEIQDGYITLYLEKDSFTFDSSNKELILSVNGVEESITFKEGLCDAQLLIDTVNGYFNSQVAFLDDSYIYFKGNSIGVSDCSSLNVLGIPSGYFNVGVSISVPDEYRFESGDNSSLSLNIDSKDVQYVYINQNSDLLVSYTKEFLVDKINTLYKDKKVAFMAPGKMILLGSSNITVKEEISTISLNKFSMGYATYSRGSDIWEKDLVLNQSTTKFCVFGLNDLCSISSTNTLSTKFKILAPTLTTTGQSRDAETGVVYLETSFDYMSIQGNFNPEGGYVVSVNGIDVYSDYDSWVYQIENLTSGSNTVIVKARDIFGQDSDDLTFNIIFNDPTSASFPEETSSLKWSKLSSVQLGDDTINKMLEAIEDTFRPILTGLTTLSDLLKKLRAFICKALGLDFLRALKKALEKYISDILNYIDNLVNGTGLYVLNTIPTSNWSDALTSMEGGFDGFISKIISSFDDELDSSRPILTESAKVGGMIFAASDSGGVNELLNSINTLKGIFSKENSDFGLVPPENLTAVGENQRIVLSWTMPMTALSPTGFFIYRSQTPGGIPRRTKTSGADFGPQYTGDIDNFEYDKVTGDIITDYDCVGILGNVSEPLDADGNSILPNWNSTYVNKDGDTLQPLKPMMSNAWWNEALSVLRFQAVKQFKFYDGYGTEFETKQIKENEQTFSEGWASKIDDVSGVFNWLSDKVLVASQTNSFALTNGKTYYYKVVPAYVGTNATGNSYEVVATASAPDLLYIEEDLTTQIKNIDEEGYSLKYNLSSAIYDKNLAVFGSSPSDISVYVDGAKVEPAIIEFNKGKITLDKRNQPNNNINVKYWGRKIKEATRAVVVGTGKGDFEIMRGGKDGLCHESNLLSIQVGKGSNLPKLVGENIPSINRLQNVTLVRDFGTVTDEVTGLKTQANSKILTAGEVARIIRSQTSGINVRVNRLSQIVIEDTMNPDIYKGSYIKIHGVNTVLGFNNNESDAGMSSGNPPNWYSIKPSDLFPIFNDVLKYIQDTANKLLNSFENATKCLTDFIDLLIAKVEALSKMAQEIKDLLEQIARQMKLQAGLYFLNIPYKSGGLEYFKSALTEAIGKPDSSDYTGGVVLMYSLGSTAKAMDLLFGSLK